MMRHMKHKNVFTEILFFIYLKSNKTDSCFQKMCLKDFEFESLALFHYILRKSIKIIKIISENHFP